MGPIWRNQSIQLRNGVTIEAFGTGQSLRGRRRGAFRPSLIICDDLQNDGHIESARQRETSRRWFEGTLLKAGDKHTNVVNLATALHRDALALVLDRTPGWTSRVFRAIDVEAKCSCSRESVTGMLKSFSKDDRDHMVQDGVIAVTCEFCNTKYVFEPAEVEVPDET